MCFGSVASFTVSAFLFSIGALVMRNIRTRKELLFAAFPFLFAIQQMLEGFLWLTIKSGSPHPLLHWLTFGFLMFAYGAWPLLCPLSVYIIEHDIERRKLLRYLILLGAGTSFYLMFSIIINPIHAAVFNCSIRYETYVAGVWLFTATYVAATILPYFISSHRSILMFGMPNLFFFIIAYFFYEKAFISVWCFFAATISLALYFFLRTLHHQPILPFSQALREAALKIKLTTRAKFL